MLLSATSMKIGFDNRGKWIISFRVFQRGLVSSESTNSSWITLEIFLSEVVMFRCEATMERFGIDDNFLKVVNFNENIHIDF